MQLEAANKKLGKEKNKSCVAAGYVTKWFTTNDLKRFITLCCCRKKILTDRKQITVWTIVEKERHSFSKYFFYNFFKEAFCLTLGDILFLTPNSVGSLKIWAFS